MSQPQPLGSYLLDAEFRVLGPVEVLRTGRHIGLGRTRERVLLAILLLQTNQVVDIDQIVADIWGDTTPADPVAALQNHVYRLRRLLRAGGEPVESRVIRRARGYLIRVEPEEIDARCFEALITEAEDATGRGHYETSARRLEEALRLWRGDPFADVAIPGSAEREIARLSELRLAAIESLFDARLALGQQSRLIADLQAFTREHPLRERAWGQLMVALYRSGRQVDALRVFHELRIALREKAGLLPSPELVRLETSILEQRADLSRPSGFPIDLGGARREVATESTPPGDSNLPLQLTTFIGRQETVAEIGRLLPRSRMVTLTGAAGAGKSRLALEVARSMVGVYVDGVRFVDLSPLDDPDLLPAVTASALGVRDTPGPPGPGALTRALRSEKLLIVLDNCEHLVRACGEMVEALLSSCPGISVLATSRELIPGTGNTVWAVAPLAAPDGKSGLSLTDAKRYEAVLLFEDRARVADPSFVLDDNNVETVSFICRQLEGIPLAIELAAARVMTLDLNEIAARLEDRLTFLVTDAASPEIGHHQSLRTALEWSHNLLGEVDRILFRRLAVFVGGFTLTAARRVCAGPEIGEDQTDELVVRLVSRSLVVKERVGGTARYRLLDTIRMYALGKLDDASETARVRDCHLGWCLELAEEAEPELTGSNQAGWYERLALDHDNLRSALTWSFECPETAEAGLRLAGALSFFWFIRGFYAEGRRWLRLALAGRGDAHPLVVAKALWGAGTLAALMGDAEPAQAQLAESLAISRSLGEKSRTARALDVMAMLATFRNDVVGARSMVLESITLARQADDSWCLIDALGELGWIDWAEGDCQAAQLHSGEALELARIEGDKQGIRMALLGLALAAHRLGDLDDAISLATDGVTVSRELGDLWFIAYFLCILAGPAVERCQYRRARKWVEEGLALARQAQAPMIIVLALQILAAVENGEHYEDAALRDLDEALALATEVNVPAPVVAPALRARGELAYRRGEADEARRFLAQSFDIAREAGDKFNMVRSLEAMANAGAAAP